MRVLYHQLAWVLLQTVIKWSPDADPRSRNCGLAISHLRHDHRQKFAEYRFIWRLKKNASPRVIGAPASHTSDLPAPSILGREWHLRSASPHQRHPARLGRKPVSIRPEDLKQLVHECRPITIACYNHIGPAGKRPTDRFKGPAAHDNRLTHCYSFKVFEIARKVPWKLIVDPYNAVICPSND